MKGYLVRKKMKEEIHRKKIDTILQYFRDLKRKQIEDALVIIVYNMRKHRKKMKLKREIARKKEEEKAKKKVRSKIFTGISNSIKK